MKKNDSPHCRSRLLGLFFVGCIVWAGCDGGASTTGEMVKPDVSPEEKGKASMDFYKSQMKGGNKAAAKK